MSGLWAKCGCLARTEVFFFFFKNLNFESITLVEKLAALKQKSGFLASDWTVPAWIRVQGTLFRQSVSFLAPLSLRARCLAAEASVCDLSPVEADGIKFHTI